MPKNKFVEKFDGIVIKRFILEDKYALIIGPEGAAAEVTAEGFNDKSEKVAILNDNRYMETMPFIDIERARRRHSVP